MLKSTQGSDLHKGGKLMQKKRSVLIVDDDVSSSQMEKVILEQTGLYAVTVCNRGSEAFEVIQATRPELVLLDIMMPDVDGTEIARRVQQDKSLEITQIVFMTALVSQEDVGGGALIGGHPFIPKPISSESLLKRVSGFFKVEN
jgi:PleD family two-component response regulator